MNVRRRDIHKKDMDPKLHHLCSQNIPFTDLLYGDTMIKDIKDIQEMNKISRNITTPRFRGRGSYVKRGRPFAGQNFRGRGRSYPHRRGTGSFMSFNRSKNSKMEAQAKR